MPLDKRWRGRRITKTGRRGPWIMVRLATDPHNSLSAKWVRLAPAAYMADRTCVYQPPTVAPQPLGGVA
jgi:hypothetical protein